MDDTLWHVTGITDVTEFQPGKGAVPSKRVDFTLMDGTVSYIVVPLEEFRRDTVAKRIHDMALHMIDVLQLTGPAVPTMPSVPESFAFTEQ